MIHKWAALSGLIALLAVPAGAATRLKELVSLEGVRDNQLIGYGLVVGLNGTGDHRQTFFSAQSLANLLQQMGVSVDPTDRKSTRLNSSHIQKSRMPSSA